MPKRFKCKKPPRHIRMCHPLSRGIYLLFPSVKVAHRAKREKETTPTHQNVPPLYRGEFTSYSPQRGVPEGRGGERTQADISEYATPLVEGNLPLIPLSEGCPKGGLGERNHPDTSECATPLSRGLYLLFPSAREAHRAVWEKETNPTHQNVPPLYRGELTPFPPQRGLPIGGLGKRNHPDISEYVTPL